MANPKQRYLNDDYLQANPTWDVEDSGWKARQVYDLIEKLQLPVGRVCEVGCGAGGAAVCRDRPRGCP